MLETSPSWIPAVIALLVGITGGLLGALWASRRERLHGDTATAFADLEERRAHLVGQLKDLEQQKDRLTTSEYEQQKTELEGQAVAALRSREQLSKSVRRTRPGVAADAGVTDVEHFSWKMAGGVLAIGVLLVAVILVVTTPPAETPDAAGTGTSGGAMGEGTSPGAVKMPVFWPGSQTTPEELGDLMQRMHDNPNDVGTLVGVGHALLGLGRLDGAEMVTRRALDLDRGNKEALVHTAALDGARGEVDQAITELRALVAKDPANAEGWLYLAIFAQSSGNRELEAESFKKFLAVAPAGLQKEAVRAMIKGGGIGAE